VGTRFQFNPFAVDVVGAELERLPFFHSSRGYTANTPPVTVGSCKRLVFQFLSVALQTANARTLPSRIDLVFRYPFYLNYQEQSASVRINLVERNRVYVHSGFFRALYQSSMTTVH
jgi:hypothetical protein